jgi:hypothetical protein
LTATEAVGSGVVATGGLGDDAAGAELPCGPDCGDPMTPPHAPAAATTNALAMIDDRTE